MKTASILFLSLMGVTVMYSSAQAERLSASQVWFDSPGNKSAYEKQITAYLAGEMLKAKRGFYDGADYHVSNSTYLNIGSYLQITDSTIEEGATVFSINCGTTTQQVTNNSSDGSDSSAADTKCRVGAGSGGPQ